LQGCRSAPLELAEVGFVTLLFFFTTKKLFNDFFGMKVKASCWKNLFKSLDVQVVVAISPPTGGKICDFSIVPIAHLGWASSFVAL